MGPRLTLTESRLTIGQQLIGLGRIYEAMKTKRSRAANAVWLLAGIGAAAIAASWRRGQMARRRLELAGQASRQPEPKPGDILLFYNARGLNRIITGFTGSPYYHAGIYAGDNTAVEARTPGVQWNALAERSHDFMVAAVPAHAGKRALDWAKARVGDGYDTLDIGIVILDRICRKLHFNYTPSSRFTCGEFVARAFEETGHRLLPDVDANETVPGDLARLLPSEERRAEDPS